MPHEKTNTQGLIALSIGKTYKNKKILDDVSLELQKGEAVALLGPNGAGKTTCFYSIAGLIKPDHGVVNVDGFDTTNLPMYRRAQLGLGYLPQEASIFRGLTVEENISAISELWAKNNTDSEARVEELLNEFSITHIRKSPAIALSGGERRRVEIARCLAANPKYILLDEPFAGVDPIAVGDIRFLVAQLKEKEIGVLITDHNVRETLEIIDRAYILHDGKVLMSGTPEQVIENNDVRKVYLGDDFRV
jgi:lipopolysaccharide export system ATP-binding protein